MQRLQQNYPAKSNSLELRSSAGEIRRKVLAAAPRYQAQGAP
jgi:hypothetical protein